MLITSIFFFIRKQQMNFVPLEAIRAKLSSMSFGMDDKYDRLTRKTTIFLLLTGKTNNNVLFSSIL